MSVIALAGGVMKEYKVVAADSEEVAEKMINEFVKEGWSFVQLSGAILEDDYEKIYIVLSK